MKKINILIGTAILSDKYFNRNSHPFSRFYKLPE